MSCARSHGLWGNLSACRPSHPVSPHPSLCQPPLSCIPASNRLKTWIKHVADWTGKRANGRGVLCVFVCELRLRHKQATQKRCCITARPLQAQSVTRLSPSEWIYLLDVQIQSCLSNSLDITYRPCSCLIHTNSSTCICHCFGNTFLLCYTNTFSTYLLYHQYNCSYQNQYVSLAFMFSFIKSAQVSSAYKQDSLYPFNIKAMLTTFYYSYLIFSWLCLLSLYGPVVPF